MLPHVHFLHWASFRDASHTGTYIFQRYGTKNPKYLLVKHIVHFELLEEDIAGKRLSVPSGLNQLVHSGPNQ